MVRIWVIPPYFSEQSERFEAAWKFDKQNNTIAIGWAKLGDPREYLESDDNQQLIAALIKQYPEYKEKNVAPQYASFIRKFYKEILEGDIVLARKGLQQIIGVGVVYKKNNLTANYDVDKGKERLGNEQEAIVNHEYYPNFMNVNWKNGFSLSPGTLREFNSFDKIIDSQKLIQ